MEMQKHTQNFFQMKCFHVFYKVLISKVIYKKITYSLYYDLIQDIIVLHFCIYVNERTKKMQWYYDI